MSKQRLVSIATIFGVYTLLFGLFIALNYLALWRTLTTRIQTELETNIQRIKNDLRFVDGKWDTTRYNADPQTAYPNASSATPLSIITVDGFVIERSKPITGFLDSADFTKLLEFSQPQTISTLSNEQWRVFSKPIIQETATVGVVTVSYYNPDPRLLPEVDKKLQDNADRLVEQIHLTRGTLDTSTIDIRNVHFDVAFEIVDHFNKVILNNGRSPSYIDRSYVAGVLKSPGLRTIRNTQTGEPFLVNMEIMKDDAGNPLAVIAAGHSTADMQDMLRNFLLSSGALYLLFIIPLSLVSTWLLRSNVAIALHLPTLSVHTAKPPTKVIFDASESVLKTPDEEIEIPEHSYQYGLSLVIFSDTTKWWPAAEVCKKLGEPDTEGTLRKYYDAALAINKKAQFKLIEYKDKSFRVHPAAR